MHPATQTKPYKNSLRIMTKSSRCCLVLQTPQISIQLSICVMCWTNKINPWRLHLTTYVLVSDVPGHAQGSRGVHASMHQSCFGSTKGTYMIIKQLGSHNYVVRRIQIILVGAKWWYTFYTTRFVFLTPPLQNDKQRRRFGCAFALFLITLMKLL